MPFGLLKLLRSTFTAYILPVSRWTARNTRANVPAPTQYSTL